MLLVLIVILLAVLPLIGGDEIAITSVKLVLSAILLSAIYAAR